MAPWVRHWARYGAAAVIAGALVPGTQAYILDSSCDPYKDFLTDGFQTAFELARSGKDVFDTLQPGGSGAKWEAQRDIVSYMFKNALSGNNPDRSGVGWTNATKVYDQVLHFDTSGNGQPEARPSSYKQPLGQKPDMNRLNTIVVYCDLKRYTPGKNCWGKDAKDTACDTSMNLNDDIDDYKSCNGVASTTNAWASRSTTARYLPSRIQICPAYLSHVQKSKVTAWSKTGFKSSLARMGRGVYEALRKIPGFSTKMDLADSFAATLLHEMTHATEEETDDVNGKNAYGWKNCRKISDAAAQHNEGTRNADSYAYFAIAAKMISQQASGDIKPMRPTADGDIQLLGGSGGGGGASSSAPSATPKNKPNRRDTADDGSGKRKVVYEVGYLSGAHMTETAPHGVTITVDGEVLQGTLYPHFASESSKPGVPPGSASHSKSGAHPSSSKSGAQPSSSKPGSKSSSSSKPGSQPSSSTPGSQSSSNSKSDSHASSSSKPGSKPSSSKPDNEPSKSSKPGQQPSSSRGGDAPSTSKPGNPPPSSKPGGGNPSTSSKDSPPIITTVQVTKDGTTTPVTYTSTKSNEGGHPTGVWNCIGPLCDKTCLNPLDPKCKKSWGLCCGWQPDPKAPPLPTPPPGPGDGPDPTGNPSNKPSDQPSKSNEPSASKSQSSKSRSSESCTKSTKTACKTSVTVGAGPDGQHTATSTITYDCSTITACSASISGGASTTTGTQVASGIIIADSPYNSQWLDAQESLLQELDADTTDPLATYGASDSASASAPKTSSHQETTLKTSTRPPSSKPSSSKAPSSNPPSSKPASSKPSNPPSSQPGSSKAPTSTGSSGPQPSSTKYTDRCKDWSFDKNSVTLVGTCTDKNGKEVKTKEDLGLCLHYNNGGLSAQNNGGINKDCTYCFFNPPDWNDHSTVWCVCKNDKDPFAKTASIDVDKTVEVMDNGYVKCFDHISAPA